MSNRRNIIFTEEYRVNSIAEDASKRARTKKGALNLSLLMKVALLPIFYVEKKSVNLTQHLEFFLLI